VKRQSSASRDSGRIQLKLTLLLALTSFMLQGAPASLLYDSGAGASIPRIQVSGATPGSHLALFDGVTPIGAAAADAAGDAAFPVASLQPGPHTFTVEARGTGVRVGQLRVEAHPYIKDQFSAASAYALGIQPQAFTVGTIDHQGTTALVAAADGRITVAKAGALGSPAILAGPAQPTAVVLADFDGNGVNDIAVSSAAGSITIYLNNGNGSYSKPVTYAFNGHAESLAIVDFNGDGVTDLIAADELGHSLVLFAGHADGTFEQPVVADTGIAAGSIAVADFNNDGVADLALTSFSTNEVSILLGDGRGSFRNAGVARAGDGPSSVIAADFNEDGATDLAVLNALDRTITTLLNNGSAIFTSGQVIGSVTAFTASHVLGTSHFDLLTQNGSELQILAGAGNGTFSQAGILSISAAPQSLFLIDITGDGSTDIVTADASGVMSVFAAVPSANTATTGSPVSGHLITPQVLSEQVVNSQTLRAQSQLGTSVTLASSNPASNLGQTITLTASVNPTGTTGTVTFYNGVSIIGVHTLTNGQAVMTTNLLPSGTNSLTARYSGDSTHNGAVSAVLSQSVAVLPQSGVQSGGFLTAGGSPHTVVAADFNGDGIPDLALTNTSSSSVMVFIGKGNGAYNAGANYTANASGFGLVAVDVNNDGSPDLVLTNSSLNEATVMLNSGTGTFSNAGTLTTGVTPQAIAAADFNNDGKADLVVANFGDGTLTIFLGNGDGTFSTAPGITIGTVSNALTSVAVADFNNDGNADIVVVGTGSSNLTVLMGLGTGAFQAGVTYAVGSAPYWVTAADLDGDGFIDLAVANASTSGNVQVLINDKTHPGAFLARNTFNAGSVPHFIGAGDFNSDGIPDLFVVNRGTSNGFSYSILTGTGTGSFSAPATTGVGNAPWSAVVADLNSDGRTDVAIASSGDNRLYLALGNGLYSNMIVTGSHTGNFTQGQVGATYTLSVSNTGVFTSSGIVSVTDSLPSALTATAITGSGWTCTLGTITCTRTDPLAVGSSYPNITLTVSVANNAGLTVTNSVTVSGGGENITNDDTSTDPTTVFQTTTLALVSSLNPSISGNQVSFTATISSPAATGAMVFFDGGVPFETVVVASGTAVLNTTLLTAGQHTISARYSGDTQYQSSSSSVVAQVVNSQAQNGFQAAVAYGLGVTSPSGVVIADFNGDGKADIAVSNSSATSKVTMLIGNGDGTFKTPGTNYSAGGNGSDPFAIAAADFNNDGMLDVVVANNGTSTVSVLINNGTNVSGNVNFKAPLNLGAGSHPQHLAIGDFNGDGSPDIAVADFSTGTAGTVAILLGNGDGTFQSAKTTSVGGNPRALAVRDFTGDGIADIAVVNYSANTLSILVGKGDGTFTAGASYTIGTNPQSVATGDVNGDGIPDLVVANNGSASVTVLTGNGDGTFNIVGGAAGYGAGLNPTGVVLNDFNGDGILDISVSDGGAGVSVLLGVGDGTFQSAIGYTAGTGPSAVATADLDGDGTSDLVVANGGASNVSVLLGGLFYSDVTVALSHTGTFAQGQTGAQYTMTVSNVGSYPTVGKVTVSDTLPSGLTATAIAGSGWTCTLATLTCTRTDSLAPGGAYNLITVTVNVSNSAAQQVTNSAAVSGGHENNSTNNTATDVTAITQLTSLTLTPSASPWVYNETVGLIATVSQSAATGTVTFSQGSTVLATLTVSSGSAILPAPLLTPGDYQFSAAYSGDAVYAPSNATLTVTVGKANATVTLSGLSYGWDGTQKPATVTTNPAGLTVSVTYNGSSTAPSDAGSYSVNATVNDSNYTGATAGTLVITPVHATVTLSISNATYDGNPHGATATTSPANLAVSITYGGSGTIPTAAGTYQISATVTTPNYAGTATGTLAISPAPVTILLSGFSATYDGTPKSVGVTTNPAGVSIKVTYNGQVAAPTAAGAYTVAASPSDPNYTGSAGGTLLINRAPVSFILSNLLTTYDGTQKTAGITSNPAGVGYTATYNTAGAPPTAAGAYNLVVTASDPNYTGSTSGTFVIQKATPTVTWPTPPAIAFGTALSAGQLNATSVTPGGFVYTPGMGAVLTSGTQTLSVVFSPLDSNNYNSVPATTTVTVNPPSGHNVSIVSTKVLSRDLNNNIVVAVTLANIGTIDATNVVVTSLKIGTTVGTPQPLSIGTIPSGAVAQATFVVAGSAGTVGTSSTWTIAGTFTNGSFTTAGRVTLP
jgi:uncharacterized repeat protein (TIGR01451 family)